MTSPKRIKVGFHVGNESYPTADTRFPEKGNPGMGGTQFTTIATAYYLDKLYRDKLEVFIFANYIDYLPHSLKAFEAIDDIDAAVKSVEQGCEIYIFRSRPGNHTIYEKLAQLPLKAIARSNNTPDVEGLKAIFNCPTIKRHVCVSREQLDGLRDHRIFEKSTSIYHAFNDTMFNSGREINKTGNTVVYVGSLIHSKGFHILAKIWPEIILKRPDAKLLVIGSGSLYGQSKKQGKWGIAEENYEADYIRPYLSDSDGNVIDSVKFLGVLGEEKIGILQQADVGVANPSGFTETFCSTALEFQAAGTPVVSAARGGLLDTVWHGQTGLLGRNPKELKKNILFLLNNPETAKAFGQSGIRFVRNKFAYEKNAQHWFSVIVDTYSNKPPRLEKMKDNYFHNYKLLRECIRITRKSVPLLKDLPSLDEVKTQLRFR